MLDGHFEKDGNATADEAQLEAARAIAAALFSSNAVTEPEKAGPELPSELISLLDQAQERDQLADVTHITEAPSYGAAARNLAKLSIFDWPDTTGHNYFNDQQSLPDMPQEAVVIALRPQGNSPDNHASGYDLDSSTNIWKFTGGTNPENPGEPLA